MNPFFFGSSSHPLYGVFHPPQTQPGKKEGVLLCPPFGQEYMRSHRAYRQLAQLLSKQGFYVMCFDYRGTGDSWLDIESVSVQDWKEDIETALNELKETANINCVSLVGLRLGGLLAATVAESIEVQKLILWDPVLSGKQYDEELQVEMTKDPDSNSNIIDKDGTLHFNGFPLTKSMREDLSKLDIRTIQPRAKSILHVASHESEAAKAIKAALSTKSNYIYSHIPAPGNWNYVDDFGGILLPRPIIQDIVKRMEN